MRPRPPRPILRRGAVRDESLGRGLGAARRPRERDGNDDQGERLGQAEERVGERGAEQAHHEHGAPPRAVREAG